MEIESLQPVISRTFRTGRQTLCRASDGKWFMHLQNSTQNTLVKVPAERVFLWNRALREKV